MLKNHNELVKTSINKYIDATTPPKFAILVTGSWGTGKTEFVRKLISTKINDAANLYETETKTYVYVSVYGVESTDVIDQAIFSETHPLLASKGGRFAAKIARGFLKGALKIDLNESDGSDDGQINFDLSKLSSSDFKGENSNVILVIDDLERSKIRPEILLGYINNFIENLGCKVIIIANEEKILEENHTNYREVKEKLVGQTYTLHPEVDAAFRRFISEIESDEARSFLNENLDFIVERQMTTGVMNLRHARQGLYLLSKIFQDISKEHWQNDALAEHFLNEFIMVNIGIRQGMISPIDLSRIQHARMSSYIKEREKKDPSAQDTRVIKFLAITNFGQLPRLLISPEMWKCIFEDGVWSSEALNQILTESHYYAKSPSWYKLWDMYDRTDQEISDLYREVRSVFDNRKFPALGDFFLAVGCFLSLAKYRLFGLTSRSVVSMSKKYLDQMAKTGELIILAGDDYERNNTGYNGMGYHCRDEETFIGIYSHYEKTYKKSKRYARPEEAKTLLKALKETPDEFKNAISWGKQSALGDFTSKPFLHCLNVNEFIEALFSIEDISLRRSVCSKIKDRFQISGIETDLKQEVSWLRRFGRELVNAGAQHPESFQAQTFATYGKGYQKQATALYEKLKNQSNVIAP